MKKLLIIGQRDSILDVVMNSRSLELTWCIALAGSHLERAASLRGFTPIIVERDDKERAIQLLMQFEFDVLLSVGCPWLLPMRILRERHRDALFLNVHPSCLPRLRGNHPINGAILYDEPFLGATVHSMEEEYDTGDIVAQICIERTADLDLGLCYHIARILEARALENAIETLEKTHYTLCGAPQNGQPTSYSRRRVDRYCNAAVTLSEELVRRVRAFGVPTQGCFIEACGKIFKALDAECIVNPFLMEYYRNAPPGSVLLYYEPRILVRTYDGIVKLWVEEFFQADTCHRGEDDSTVLSK